jgi:hypothetical protein
MQLRLPFEDVPRVFLRTRGTLRPFPFPLAPVDEDFLLDRDADVSLYHDPVRISKGLPPPLQFFAGVCDPTWNGWPTLAGPLVCVSPFHGKKASTRRENIVALNPDAQVIVDSGAFSLEYNAMRPTPDDALRYQYDHMDKYGYGEQAIGQSSLDVFIDEMWSPDETGEHCRVKQRWSEQDAAEAVEETVKGAQYLSTHRDSTIPCILNVQGVSPLQYLTCAQRIVPLLHPGDILGLGGWCIVGRSPAQMMPVFRATMQLLIPFLATEGIQRVHVWGLCYAEALGFLLWLCDLYGITLSTDTAMPAQRPVFGEYGYADWHMRDYKAHRPPLHLSASVYRDAGMDQMEDENDPYLIMHYNLMNDEEYAKSIGRISMRKYARKLLKSMASCVATMGPFIR